MLNFFQRFLYRKNKKQASGRISEEQQLQDYMQKLGIQADASSSAPTSLSSSLQEMVKLSKQTHFNQYSVGSAPAPTTGDSEGDFSNTQYSHYTIAESFRFLNEVDTALSAISKETADTVYTPKQWFSILKPLEENGPFAALIKALKVLEDKDIKLDDLEPRYKQAKAIYAVLLQADPEGKFCELKHKYPILISPKVQATPVLPLTNAVNKPQEAEPVSEGNEAARLAVLTITKNLTEAITTSWDAATPRAEVAGDDQIGMPFISQRKHTPTPDDYKAFVKQAEQIAGFLWLHTSRQSPLLSNDDVTAILQLNDQKNGLFAAMQYAKNLYDKPPKDKNEKNIKLQKPTQLILLLESLEIVNRPKLKRS